MLSKKLTLIAGALLLTCLQAYSAIRTVSKSADDGGQYRTITEAINNCEAGDEIVIKDFGIYEERIVITQKNNLTLRSEDPGLSKKPTIRWLDTKNVGPRNAVESKIDSLITYQHNGALFIYQSQNVTVSGLNIDGDGLAPFGYSGIWNSKDPLFFGNCGVNILQSGNVAIRYCDIKNAFYGVYVNDQNPGGVFTYTSSYDFGKWAFKPMSAFGKAGNHIIEYSRIHNNSFGLLFESSWDLGSTVRYNLIYENHHLDSMYAKIKAMPDGGNQPGGAFMFKDDLFSPLAIYNNTLWHNSLIFVGHWKAGHQHLVFNNIFAEPYKYWKSITAMSDWMDISPKLTYRMHNCLFAAQKQGPESCSQIYQVSIITPDSQVITGKDTITAVQGIQLMNGMTKWEIEGVIVPITLALPSGDTTLYERADWVIKPGALSLDFPKEATIRWLEMKFKSTDSSSSDFLVPDLSDSITKACIVNAGWKESGIADIGASVPFAKGSNIIPVDPAYITDNKIVLHFKLDVPEDVLPKLNLKYLRLVKGLVNDPNAFGAVPKLVIPQSNIVSLGSFSISGNTNLIELSIPASDTSDQYGFVEMIFNDGTGSSAMNVVGFIPYRKLFPPLSVQILDLQTSTPVIKFLKGEKVLLKVTYDSINTPTFDSAKIRLLSGEKIYGIDGKEFTVAKNFLTTLTDTVVFNHTGKDALVINTYGTLDLQQISPVGCSPLFNIFPSSAIISKSVIKYDNQKNSHYVLFSLSGKKIGTFTMDQLIKLKTSKNRQNLPSGMYCAFSESAVDKKIVKGSPFKVIVP